MKTSNLQYALLLFLLLSCKNYTNEMIEWSQEVPFHSSVNEVKKIAPNYLKIDWENPENLDSIITRYYIKEIKGSRGILKMSYYLEFQNEKYISVFGKK